jgi:hypothetical protein
MSEAAECRSKAAAVLRAVAVADTLAAVAKVAKVAGS